MTKVRAAEILQMLRQTFPLPMWAQGKLDPYKTLVQTILSQNTADSNTERAFESLSKRFEIKPEVLAEAEICKIEESIKVAGLYKNKAKTIKQVSKIIVEKYHGTLQPILSLPLDQARKALTQFSGVGPKTADVVLLFTAGQPTIPVDTHVLRVSKRLGFAPANADYEAVRRNLQQLYDPNNYLVVHLLLIAHGRAYCKAIRPLCQVCPINALCPSKELFLKIEGKKKDD